MVKFGRIAEKNDKNGTVTVRFERPEACGKCGACGSLSQKGEVVLPSDRDIGEWVRVEMPENRFLQATALVYIIPLLGLLAGLLIGFLLGGGSDLFTLLGAVCGISVALVTLHLINKHVSKKPEWMPRITAVYHDKPTYGDLGCGVS
ncbi:MAG: SoxR reducing system RseC family protein [Clostridiales bacterium]|nr:SoxR reducing system RseC family protein [Clostridiales bacterium]